MQNNDIIVTIRKLVRDGDFASAVSRLREEMMRCADHRNLVELKLQLASILRKQGKAELARQELEQVAEIAEHEGWAAEASNALRQLAGLLTQAGAHQEAWVRARRALSLARSSRNHHRIADTMAAIAHLEEPLGRLEAALAWFMRGLTEARRCGYTEREGTILSDMGRIRATLGRYEQAWADLESAEYCISQAGAPDARLAVKIRKAVVLTAIDDDDEAVRMLCEVASEAQELSLVEALTDSWLRLGQLYLRQRAFEAAQEALMHAFANAPLNGRAYHFAACSTAELRIRLGYLDVETRQYLQSVLKRLSSAGPDLDLLRAFIRTMALYSGAVGNAGQAAMFWQDASALAALVRDEGAYRTHDHADILHEVATGVAKRSHGMLGDLQ